MGKKVAVIGKGSWGGALFHVLKQNTRDVRWVGKGEIVTEEIIVIAVPTNNIAELASVLQPRKKRPIIINTAKGIEERTHRLPHEIVTTIIPTAHYFTLIGPGFAGEVQEGIPTLVNLGYGREKRMAQEVAGLFQTETFRVRPCEAVNVLELAAALKNIYAIGCGIADGLGYGTNTRAMLIVLAQEEMTRFFAAQKLRVESQSAPGILGDLVLTCNSAESRNFRFGKYLTSNTVKKSLEKVSQTVEGNSSLESLAYLEKTTGAKLPLAGVIYAIVQRDSPRSVRKVFLDFIEKV